MCVVCRAPPPSALPRPRRAEAAGVCVCQHLHANTAGWLAFLRGGRFGNAMPSCCATPFPRVAQPPAQPAAAANQLGGGALARVRYICGILCHLTRRDGGRTAVPEACGGWVALTTGQFLTGSTRPSVQKQSELLPSTEFPDPSPSSYRVARPLEGGGGRGQTLRYRTPIVGPAV